jgi:phosphotransacetylase
MSEQIPLEVLKAVKTMQEQNFLTAMLEGDSEKAGESLKRMTYALSQIDQYKPLCGDHIVPIGECGCKI